MAFREVFQSEIQDRKREQSQCLTLFWIQTTRKKNQLFFLLVFLMFLCSSSCSVALTGSLLKQLNKVSSSKFDFNTGEKDRRRRRLSQLRQLTVHLNALAVAPNMLISLHSLTTTHCASRFSVEMYLTWKCDKAYSFFFFFFFVNCN